MTDYLVNGTVLKKRYVVGKKIENSDFSNIYLGYDGDTEIVIKECFPRSLVIRGSDNEVFTVKYKDKFNIIKKSFLNEAAILENLNHTNIVKIYDKFRINNTIYIITEYCKGVTLKEYILDNNLSEEEAVKLFLKILKVIKYIHKQGYLHRDIKPSNIIVKGKTLKILDFGSAIAKKSGNAEYVRLTSGYSPIEMYSLKSINTEGTDVYSLFALLYFMLNKHKPMDVLKRFYYNELIFEGHVSKNLKEIITNGLMMEDKDRYSNILEVEKILKK